MRLQVDSTSHPDAGGAALPLSVCGAQWSVLEIEFPIFERVRFACKQNFGELRVVFDHQPSQRSLRRIEQFNGCASATRVHWLQR